MKKKILMTLFLIGSMYAQAQQGDASADLHEGAADKIRESSNAGASNSGSGSGGSSTGSSNRVDNGGSATNRSPAIDETTRVRLEAEKRMGVRTTTEKVTGAVVGTKTQTNYFEKEITLETIEKEAQAREKAAAEQRERERIIKANRESTAVNKGSYR